MPRRVNRRTFVSLLGAGAPFALAGRLSPPGQAPPGGAPGVRGRESFAARVLAAYDRQGNHRTGSEVDRRSAEWLMTEAARCGGRARLEGFGLERLDIREAVVEVGGRRFDALPFFDAPPTGARGLEAAIADDGIHLAVADNAAISTEGEFLREVRRSGPARAIVVLTATAIPGLVPSNARQFEAPYGIPVVQVSGEARPAFEAARIAGRPVRVTSHSVRRPVTAFNVVAEIAGRDPSLAPVVVITPRSGWWRCAAERGGGLACWLETIRTAAAARRPARRLVFLASSGHELGHLGLEAFLHEHAALVAGAHAWIHLGANIGASAGGATPAGVRLQASSDEMAAAMAGALTAAGAPMADPLPRGRVPAGEARNLHLGGARYVSLIGQGHRWFHHVDDRYPRAVTAAWVARYATAVAQAAAAFATA